MNIDERVNEWRKGKALVNIKEENPYIFNSWRSFRYTDKGKKAGWSEQWNNFQNFYNDMKDSYVEGYRLIRIDKTKPFSKDNCKWVSDDEISLYKDSTVLLEYDNKKLSIKEWAVIANTTPTAIKNRYYKHKDWDIKDIIFGKRANRGSKTPKDCPDSIRAKASKMISAYKCRDKKNGLPLCDIDIDWMIDNIMSQSCVYCGDTSRVGCDRIDNNKGHTKDNVVPCCYECNCARNNNFSFEEMKILGKAIKEIKKSRIIKIEIV